MKWSSQTHNNRSGLVGMSYSVAFDEEHDIVVATVSGEASDDDHKSAFSESVEMCRNRSCSRLLVDLRTLRTAHLNTVSCFNFGEQAAKLASSLRLAHVLPVDPGSREDVVFTSTVQANRGIQTRDFDSIEDAKQWLFLEP
jgi:hypothetical protein